MQSARGFEYGVRHIISEDSGPLTDVLLSTLNLDHEQSEKLIQLGSIYVNHKRVSENIFINQKDYLRAHTKPRRFLPNDGLWASRILFDNEHFLVARKISGLPVHASVDNRLENLQAYLEQTLHVPLLVTHRLDVPTQGLIVFAKTSEFQTEFNKMLVERRMNKTYRTLVEGQDLTPQILKHYMEPSPRAPKKVVREPQENWQECLLEILSVEARENDHSELRIKLITGRTHQIRAQLGCEGHPIVGDFVYGAKKIWSEEKIELEACELEFTDPLTGVEYHFAL